MTADMDYRTEIVAHANSVKRLSATEENNLVDLVNLAIERFHDGWGQFFTEEEGRLTRAIEHIDRALAPMLVKISTFHAVVISGLSERRKKHLHGCKGRGRTPIAPSPTAILNG